MTPSLGLGKRHSFTKSALCQQDWRAV